MRTLPPPAPRWRVVVEALPLTALLTLLIAWQLCSRPANEPPRLIPVSAESAQALAAVFAQVDYGWPPEGAVPRLALRALPPDLHELPVAERKALFFSSLTPLVLAENERVREKRARLQALLAKPAWSEVERLELVALAERYAVAGELEDPITQRRLLARVDEIPLGLALAQAAKESGWGTSRFAQQGRNLFGVWTWDASQGLVPAARVEGARHLVRVFPDLQASVRNYLHTLNTGAVYSPLRRLRAQRRAAGEAPRALELSSGLARYSERGEAYVQEVAEMILINRLEELDDAALAGQSRPPGMIQGWLYQW